MISVKDCIDRINKSLSIVDNLSTKKKNQSLIAIEGLKEILKELNNFNSGYIIGDLLERIKIYEDFINAVSNEKN